MRLDLGASVADAYLCPHDIAISGVLQPSASIVTLRAYPKVQAFS